MPRQQPALQRRARFNSARRRGVLGISTGGSAERAQAWWLAVEVFSRHLTAQRGLLIDATLGLLDELADPCPKLGAAARGPLAEHHLVDAADHPADFHPAEIAPFEGSRWDRGHGGGGVVRAT